MRFAYTGVEVRDLDRSIRFYMEGLGMELTGRFKVAATEGENADLRSPGSEPVLELNWYPRRRYRAGSELDHLAFDVQAEDVDAVVARLEGLGGTRVRPTDRQPTYDLAFVKDPDGIWIELFKARVPSTS